MSRRNDGCPERSTICYQSTRICNRTELKIHGGSRVFHPLGAAAGRFERPGLALVQSHERLQLQEALETLLHRRVPSGVADVAERTLRRELRRVQHVDDELRCEVDHWVRLQVQEGLVHREGCGSGGD